MKAKLIIMGALCAIAFTANAQTKGTNTLGLGVGITTSTSGTQSSEYKTKSSSFSLGYGHFIKDNEKLGIAFSYGLNNYNYGGSAEQNFKNYGVNATYQKYYPLVKKLYAYAGGIGSYDAIREKFRQTNETRQSGTTYTLGARGGLTWFVSKHFAFETNLLAANITYNKTLNTSTSPNGQQDYSTTAFNLNTQGFIDDLGFKIYLLF